MGTGRGRAPPPAGRSYQAAQHRPCRPPTNPERRLPGRTSPRDTRLKRDPTARAWHRARTRTTRGSQSAAGHAQPQPRSRADLTRRPPPTRRRRAHPSPMRSQARACNCRPPRPRLLLPHPQRRQPEVGGAGYPNTAADSPQTPAPADPAGGVSNKGPTGDGNWGGGRGMRRRGLTRVQPPPGSAGVGVPKGSECGLCASCGRGGAASGMRRAG